jgi:hypothetical protein
MRRAYTTDLSDAEWAYLEAHLPAPQPYGRPRMHSPREILNAIFYIVRSGCAWRLQKDGGDESKGHESGRKIVEILAKDKSEYTEEDIEHMRRVVSYVHRHQAQGPKAMSRTPTGATP